MRWSLLYNAMVDKEKSSAAQFEFVLRLRPDMRPDSLLHCVLTPISLDLAGYDAVQDNDFALLLRRDAANVALTAYEQANRMAHCQLKVELCVSAILMACCATRCVLVRCGFRHIGAEPAGVLLD